MNIIENEFHLERQQWKASLDDRYGLELLRYALVQQTDEARLVLQQYFGETMLAWIDSHPHRDVALLRNSVENYIARTFARFWNAVHDQRIEFPTLPAALCYLRATLNGIIMDTLRSRSRETPFLVSEYSQELTAEETIDSRSTWNSIESLLPDQRERRLAYLLYCCGLKPRDIVKHCPEEFGDVKEIYRLNYHIIEKLRDSQSFLRHLSGYAV